MVDTIYKVMPGVLTEHGKTANPYPNVDSHSGVLLWHYGFTQYEYYIVLFGVSRAIGALSRSSGTARWGCPSSGPKSLTTGFISHPARRRPGSVPPLVVFVSHTTTARPTAFPSVLPGTTL